MIATRKIVLLIALGAISAIAVVAFGARLAVWRHQSLQAAATPPKGILTIEDFKEWKGSDVLGSGMYTDTSKRATYQVLLAPAGRFLASGPSAYLFDEKGHFIEWTPDMGDTGTSINDYDLSSGHLHRTD